MVNNLQFLRSVTAGNTPVALEAGQIAFNLVDKKLFVGNGSDTITRLDGTTESVALGSGYFETDLTVLTANAYTDQKIADLVDAAPNLLNTLNELAAAIGDDANFVTTITSSIANVQSSLSAESSRAQAAEASLTSGLSAEVSRAQAAEGVLTADLAAEVARASAAEATLVADLGAEVARAVAAEGVLTADLSAEAIARANADTALQSNLDSETAARIAGDNALQSSIAAESAARAFDISAANAAVLSEQSRALAAESALSARILDIENGIDLGTFDALVPEQF